MARACGAAHTAAFLSLVVWITLCASYLATADTPWDPEITRRVDAGDRLKDEQVRTIAFWWGALVNLGGAIVLALAAPLWARKTGQAGTAGSDARLRTPGLRNTDWKVTIGLLLLVTLTAGVLRAPRLDHSFTNDEEWAWRKNGHGYWKAGEEGAAMEFKDVSWTATLLTNPSMNNHVLQTAASRMANAAWQDISGRDRPEFSERAVRMPSFVAGLASVLLLGVLGTLVGGPRSGIGASLLLALSPWHLRYAVEGRGYSLMILFVIAALLASVLAIERRQLRWWLLFAASQACYMLAFPGAAYVAIAHCVFIAVSISGQSQGRRLEDMARFLGAGVLSVMLFLGTQVPATLQLAELVKQTTEWDHEMSIEWVHDMVSHLVAGIPWECPPQVFHNGMSTKLGWNGEPYYVWVVVVVFPLLAILGWCHMAVTGWKPRLVTLPVVAGGMLAAAQNALQGTVMFGWYVVYLLVPFALGVSWAADRIAPPRSRRFAWFLALTLALYGLTVVEPLSRISRFQRQPIRQVVERVRGSAGVAGRVDDGGIITATFSTSARQVLSYDPWVRFPEDVPGLEALMLEAETSGKSLVVYFCDEQRAVREWPELLVRVANHPDFEQTGVIKGLEAMFRYSVYRWKGRQAGQ